MECRKQDKKFRIISVGRISPIKNLDILIEAADILRNKNFNFEIEIIGASAVESDKKYFEKLKKIIEEKNLTNIVKFIGSVPYKDIVGHYAQADLSVNLCPTGGMDKAVLESMACGIPVIVFNKTFSGMMAGYESRLILENKDKAELAKKIKDIIVLDERQREEIGLKLRHEVEEKHNLSKLVKTIINHL
jgi:colanic acid/amylovoran biosynthesis glycosyltransferase